MPLCSESLAPDDAAWQLVTASWITHAARTMADLELADHLAAGPMTIEALATASGAHAPSLSRLVRALVGLGFIARVDDERFTLTPMGEYLRSDIPGSAAGFSLGVMSSLMERPMLQLTDAIRTGEATFPAIYGQDFWSYLSSHPDDQTRFDTAMSTGSTGDGASLLRICDFEGIATLVDIGGGEGQMISEVLQAHPQMRGILFDRPEALAQAGTVLERFGVRDRCETAPGDFFVSVPRGGDAYLLSIVIHDWPDEEALKILRNCYQAMQPGSRIWISEGVMDETDEYNRQKLVDLLMLVLFAAKERTFEEHRILLEEAGFVQISALADPDNPWRAVIQGIHP
jgi:hypothetical protein